MIAVCLEIHTKHVNTLYEQNVELFNVKLEVHIVNTELQRVSTSCSAFDMAVCHGRSLFTLSVPSRLAEVQISHNTHRVLAALERRSFCFELVHKTSY
jgi:hypothetical protein